MWMDGSDRLVDQSLLTGQTGSSIGVGVVARRRENVAKVLGISCVAMPWFWPVLAGPLPAMWPDLLAWTSATLLLALWPFIRTSFSSVVATGWLIAALGNAFLGFFQYFNFDDQLYPFVAYTIPGYVTGNVHQINMFATLQAIGLLCLWFLYRQEGFNGRWAIFLAIILTVSLSASASRTGLVHLLLIAIIAVHWQRASDRWLVPVMSAVVFVYGISSWILPWALWEFRGYSLDRELFARMGLGSACMSRRVLWENMIHLVSLKPLTGWGVDSITYAHYMTAYPGERFCMKLSHAHNLPLHVAVLWGIPAAAGLSLLTAICLWALKPWRAISEVSRFAWGVLGLIMFHSMVEYPLWFGIYQLAFALAVLMVWYSPTKVADRPAMALKYLGASMIMLFGLLFVAWDYLKVSQLYTPPRWQLPSFRENTFDKARDNLLFPDHVLIAQVVATKVVPSNAEIMLEASLEALKIAPDSRIIRQVLRSAALSGRPDLIEFHTRRYRETWPIEYAEWLAEQSQ
jgi:O-antigen polymerase